MELDALSLVHVPIWVYDASRCCNVWGNRAAQQLFSLDKSAFEATQLDRLAKLPQEQRDRWQALNDRLATEVQAQGREVSFRLGQNVLIPGCPANVSESHQGLTLLFSPVKVNGTTLCLAQELAHTQQEENQMRMVEICNNHPMFQFLFNEEGQLLAANRRAMDNMREHLGPHETYTLSMYLSIGECDGFSSPDDMYNAAMKAIFKEGKPSYRFPQLRWSKRHAGKFRWVLYEMWPLPDPVTGRPAVLVCEQNISQVKAVEESIRKQNKRLEAQLEEALAQRTPDHKPLIDIDTPADKTLKLLDKLMRGLEVSPREAMELRDAILQAGDLRQPVNLSEQLMRHSQTTLDSEVSQSLIQLLSTRRTRPQTEGTARGGTAAGGSRLRTLREVTDSMHGGSDGGAAPGLPEEGEQDWEEDGHALMVLAKNMPDELASVLSRIDDWQFDAFKLSDAAGGRPLSLLSYVLMKRADLMTKWSLDEHKLVRFLMTIEDGYANHSYHNAIHAADVLRTMHVLVTRGGLISSGCCDEVGLMACYLSAVVHDYEHKGVNNDWLVRMSDTLAVLYNDRSPMENHHLAASFKLLYSTEYNFMSKVSSKVREQLRKQIIEMVLATDMKQHFAITSQFQAKLQLNGRASANSSGPKARASASDAGPANAPGGANYVVMDEDQRSLVLQVALKCADLGHLASPRPVHRRWVCFLEEEFFRQGDSEKAHRLQVSPLMDREKNGITKSQVGFFDLVALPLFQSFALAYPDAHPLLDAVRDNYHMWREEALMHAHATK